MLPPYAPVPNELELYGEYGEVVGTICEEREVGLAGTAGEAGVAVALVDDATEETGGVGTVAALICVCMYVKVEVCNLDVSASV